MRLLPFFKDKCLLLLLHLSCMAALAAFLYLTGYGSAGILLILIFWLLILSAWLGALFLRRRKYFGEIAQIMEGLDQRYLLGELLPRSFLLEDSLYREMIHASNKAVIEGIRSLEQEQKDYREYIESWIHEVKAPITGISLLSESGRKSRDPEGLRKAMGEICLENQRIENYVDMALYYARSEQVYKDYRIQRTDLQQIGQEVLEKNRLLLIESRVQARVDCPDPVYTDRKWILFILNQMILNSVRYCSSRPVFSIYTRQGRDGVVLTVEDNGTGIRPEELSRIFEKGFTGTNGRERRRSTGMGLYLCRKLCDKLGIGLKAESEYGKGTRLLLTFPISRYVSR